MPSSPGDLTGCWRWGRKAPVPGNNVLPIERAEAVPGAQESHYWLFLVGAFSGGEGWLVLPRLLLWLSLPFSGLCQPLWSHYLGRTFVSAMWHLNSLTRFYSLLSSAGNSQAGLFVSRQVTLPLHVQET